ncbi:MAG: hypothetical protein HYT80_12090 [Euryarchaeota archaeon]|nr:hypothetical protein [Euryarchaeota archaeon]
MRAAVLATALAFLVLVSGCAGDAPSGPASARPSETAAETAPSPTNETSAPAPAPNRTAQLNVTIRDAPAKAKADAPITIRWELRLDDDNASRAGLTTSLRWGPTSRADDALADDAYANEAGKTEGAEAPGDFEATFTVASAGTVYARALAVDNGTPHWSPEVSIVVEAVIPPTIHTVNIFAAGPIGTFVGMSNSMSITIKAGDGVKWHNNDNVASHSAEADAGAPEAFHSGGAGGGQDTGIVYFTKTGTYAYHCGVHPGTMTGPAGGRIVVQA